MDKREVFEFVNKNPNCFLASVEDNKPHVRAMMLYRADENGVVFHTGKAKDVHKQLMENPYVELVFINDTKSVQVRVSGAANPNDDLEFKKEIVSNREFMKPWIEKEGYEALSVFVLKNAEAAIWTMSTNFDPKEVVSL